MNKTSPIYNDTIQKELDDLICRLDENPHICTNPIEDSSYMGFTLADTEKSFMKHIKDKLYDKFLAYIDAYRKDCINTYAIKTYFVPVIKRLLSHYEDAVNSLYESELRDKWSEYFNESPILNAEQNLKKQAYQFFFNAAGVQIFFLGKLADKMKEYLIEFESAVPKPEPEYYFTIRSEFASQRHNILYDIHKNLKEMKYVDCTDDAFRKVFTTKEPKPIKWLKSVNSLTYFIKTMTCKLLIEKDDPSNGYIAERYIHVYKNENFFPRTKIRHDKDPSPKVTEFIDKIVDNAIKAYSKK